MFTVSVKVDCSFTACRDGSAKYQNMFDISLTLHNSVSRTWIVHLETVLSCISTAYSLHFPS